MPAGQSDPIRVVIVDDHPVFRRGLRALLDTLGGIAVIGEAGDGESALRACEDEPDVVLMDLHMPGMGGIEATRRIASEHPGVVVLVMTMYDDDQTVVTAIQAGARGYLLKGADQEEISRALRAVASGEVIFGPGVAVQVLGMLGGAAPQPTGEVFPELTGREREILELLAQGQRTSAIAAQLYLSPKTVSNALTSIFAKLQVGSRAEAIVRAREHGLGRG